MKIRNLLIFILSGIFFQCTFSTPDSIRDNTYSYDVNDISDFEEGKCYAKIMMPDEYSSDPEEYIIYTGDEAEEEVDIETITVETRPAGTKWVKKKADKNCRSANPDDCLVWCLVEVPAKTETLTILKDTTQSKDFEIKSISKQQLAKKGGFSAWKEVVCKKDITELLVHQIQDSLAEKGYYNGEYSTTLDRDTKAALTNFQKDNHLPVGNLDFETMAFLGLSVD